MPTLMKGTTPIGALTTDSANLISYDGTNSGLAATDVQDAIDEVVEKEFVLSNQSLSFSGTTATISDSRVTADTYVTAYFNDATISYAAAAGVYVDTSAGTITFTATTTPSATLVCDIVCKNS